LVLSQTAEYALRALARLAALEEGEALRAVDLAAQTSVPAPYASKILRQLVVAGLLEGRKGHGGGFRLARDPEDIRFSDVLEALEELGPVERCAFGWEACDESRPCPLHPAWKTLQVALRDWAERTTLADVAADERASRARPARPARASGRGRGRGRRSE
jgi:Rrf2 family protein